MYVLFCVFTGLAFLFLILGTGINPTVVSWFSPSRKITTKYGSTRFDLPQIVDTGQANTAFVTYNMTGYDPISEGDSVELFVEVDFPYNVQWEIQHIEVRPDNAFMVIFYPPSTSIPSQPYPSYISMRPLNDSRGAKWFGFVLIELGAAGPFGATVDVTAVPAPALSNFTPPKYENPMYFHDTIGTITIAQHGTLREQTWYQNQDLSLTLFILFFASVDIAVTLYDHAYEVVTTNQKEASEQKPKNREDTLPEQMPPPIIKRQPNRKSKSNTNRRHAKTKQNQRKQV